MNNNNPIFDHMNQCFDQLIKPQTIKTYKITIKKDGVITQWTAKGINLNKAEDSVQAFVRGNIEFLGGKDITNERD